MIQIFAQGGWHIMIPLTIILLALLVSIWKAPKFVVNLGRLAWGVVILGLSYDWLIGLDEIQAMGGVAQDVLAGGLKVSLIPVLYAAFIYIISVVAEMILSRNK